MKIVIKLDKPNHSLSIKNVINIDFLFIDYLIKRKLQKRAKTIATDINIYNSETVYFVINFSHDICKIIMYSEYICVDTADKICKTISYIHNNKYPLNLLFSYVTTDDDKYIMNQIVKFVESNYNKNPIKIQMEEN